VVLPLTAIPQQQLKIHRIGFLGARSRSTPSSRDLLYEAFLQGMRDLGYVEGRNLAIEWRFADGKYERLPGLAAELVKLKPEVLVCHATPPAEALKRATTTLPIVAVSVADPVGSGLVASLRRPGGNVTGVSNITSDTGPKQLELLKTVVPTLSHVAVLVNPGAPVYAAFLQGVRAAAQRLGVMVLQVDARTSEEIEAGFRTMRAQHADGLITTSDSFLSAQRASMIAALALDNRLPAMGPYPDDALTHDLLMSYGPNVGEIYRRGATYVDKILKGAKPGDLPVEEPTKLDLVVNLKTAKVLGIKMPQAVIARADRVIE
jgi:putative ABC transport system substrate-binding protein